MKKEKRFRHKYIARYPRKMKKELKKHNQKLIQKYPFLMPDVANYDYTWNELESGMPKGWWKRFGIPLCEDLREVLVKNDCIDKYRIMQVKEKYGQLRIYALDEPEEWRDHMWAWEYISEHTCVNCGKFPIAMINDAWISPWCDKCFIEKEMSRNCIKEDAEKRLEEIKDDSKLRKTLTINTYSKEGDTVHKIDLMPYYEKIGYKINEKNFEVE